MIKRTLFRVMRFRSVLIFWLAIVAVVAVAHCLPLDSRNSCLGVDPACNTGQPIILYLIPPDSDFSEGRSGRHIVIHGNNTAQTSVYEPSSNTFVSGPSLTGSVGQGGYAFESLTRGVFYEMTILHGGSTTNTSIWDPTNGTQYGTFLTGPSLTATAGAGASAFQITTGADTDKFLIVLGDTTGNTNLFDPTTNSISSGPVLTGNVGAGGHSIPLTIGPNAGQFMVFLGGGSATTNFYNPGTSAFSAGPAVGAAVSNGGHSFSVASGPQAGNIIVAVGNFNSIATTYNPVSNSFNARTPFSAVETGGNTIELDNLSYLIMEGNTGTNTRLYDSSTDTFSVGPATPVNVQAGASGFRIESGLREGEYLIVAGNGSTSSFIYDPVANTFSTGPTLTGAVGSGGTSFEIPDL